ncbi:MAG: HIT family protein [Parvularculaceae bacterium]
MPLAAPYDDTNVFAQIIRGELPCVKVFEDDVALAFMDVFPQSRGHTLVIPKHARAAMLFDIDPDALAALIVRVQNVARAVLQALEPGGVKIVQFNGALAGQTVFHLHFHIIPVFEGENLAPHAGGKADAAELEAVAAMIRKAL